MSRNPHFIIMNDVDQKKVTSNAIKIDAVLESGFEKIFTSYNTVINYLTKTFFICLSII